MRSALLVVLLSPMSAFAHKLEIVAKLPADAPTELRVEVGYDDGTPAEGATVTLTDRAGKPVAEGATDDKGVCVLERPKAGWYTLTADDGAGHRAVVRPKIGDVGTTEPPPSRPAVPMTVVGLAVIVGGTLFVWWLVRSRR